MQLPTCGHIAFEASLTSTTRETQTWEMGDGRYRFRLLNVSDSGNTQPFAKPMRCRGHDRRSKHRTARRSHGACSESTGVSRLSNRERQLTHSPKGFAWRASGFRPKVQTIRSHWSHCAANDWMAFSISASVSSPPPTNTCRTIPSRSMITVSGMAWASYSLPTLPSASRSTRL